VKIFLLLVIVLSLSACQTAKVTLPNGVSYEATQSMMWVKRGPVVFTQTGPDTWTLSLGSSETDQTSVVKKALLEAANKLP